jgi:internalin A
MRRKLVDELCSAMKKQETDIKRDCNELEAGDRISEFMDRLVEGDFIICVISNKYLRSPYCMYELFHIYRKCGDEAEQFLKKVVPLILPDAKVNDVADRLEYAGYWKKQRLKLEKQIKKYGLEVVGKEAIRKYFNIKEFSHNVSDILELLVDELIPRDFDRMAREGFKEVLQLVKGKVQEKPRN